MMVRRGFTLVEVLVVMGIVAVLSSLLFPVFASVRGAARQTSCASNQRQLGMALMMYVADNDDRYVPNGYFHRRNPDNPVTDLHYAWGDLLFPYTRSTQVFDCPAGRTKWRRYRRYPYTYSLNQVYASNPQYGGIFGGSAPNEKPPLLTSEVAFPSKTIFCGDGELYQTANLPRNGSPLRLNVEPPEFRGAQGAFVARHHGGCVVCFLDGHVKWMSLKDLARKKNALYVRFTKTDEE